ncbi:MAG TPA: TonB-dependent receptor [Pyrinomonadaceae bacterium]|jgi:iron complex outermembrane receptor protein
MTVSKRHRHLFNFGLFFLLAAICLVTAASAQNQNGVLQGVVTDENQAIIPEAKIVLRDEKGFRREIISGVDGSFSFKNLGFGKYVLTVEKDGFTAVEREILLSAPEQNSDLTLAPSAVSESVTIILDSAEMAVETTLKLPVSIRETPRSISVIGAERIREQNFRQVSDFLTYVPGTTPNSYRNGSYHFYSRGYRMSPDDTRLDGFAGVNVGSGGFGASMFGIEEAVVLRGPASLVYGQTSAPGGFINLISKKPQAQRFTRVDLRGGGYSGNGVSLFERPSFGIDIDTTGALTKNERILYRALLTLENANYFTANTLDRNRYANASVAFKLDEEGRYVLTPSVQYTRYNRPYGGGIVISPTTSLRTNDGINSPINENDLSPLDVNLFGGRRIEKTGWAGLDFRGVVSEKIRVNAAYRFVSFDTDINSFTPQVTTAAQINQLINQKTVSRIQAKSLTERKYNNFNADASYEWLNTGWWKNTTQIGFYERVFDSRATTAQGAIPAAQSPINIYTGRVSSPLVDNFPPIAFGARTRDIVWNGFVQNRTSLDNGRWNFTLGLNYGQNKPATGAVRKSDLMPNASIVFNATPEFTLYASYSTSFNPIDPDLEDAQGNRGTFAPTLGANYEIGAKYDLFNRRVSMTVALFQNQIDNALVQSDVNVLNPRGNRYYTPAGTRRARGAEMTGEFQVRQDLRVTAGLSYLDAIYKGFPSSAAVSSSPIPNSRAEKSPRWAYNIYTRYDRAEGFLKGFGAGLGLFWQGKRLGSNGAQTFAAPDPLVLPAYTRVDSALFYRLNKHVNFAFNVENMFDALVYVNASVGSSIEIAAPRAMTFRTTFNF